VDLVSDFPHFFNGPAGRVFYSPVLINPGAQVRGAGFLHSTAQRDYPLGLIHHLFGEGFGALMGQVNSRFPHYFDGDWGHFLLRRGSRGDGEGAALGEMIEKGLRHLAAGGIADTNEKHSFHAFAPIAVRL
jgi:hypothetical protein